jgi:hypothetical protein
MTTEGTDLPHADRHACMGYGARGGRYAWKHVATERGGRLNMAFDVTTRAGCSVTNGIPNASPPARG